MFNEPGEAIGGPQRRPAQFIQKAQGGEKFFVLARGLFQLGSVAADRRRVNALRGFGADAGVKFAHPRKGRKIQRVNDQSRQGHNIFNMRRVGIAQPAVLFKGNAQLAELHFEVERLIARPEKHGDFLGRGAVQKLGNGLGRQRRLREVIKRTNKMRKPLPLPLGVQMLVNALPRVGKNGVGQVQNRLNRAVVFLKLDELCGRKKARKIKNIAHIRPAKSVNGLGVVAHHHDVAVLPGEKLGQPRLHGVGVLVFIHHNMREAGALKGQKLRVRAQMRLQREKKVVIIKDAVPQLIGRVSFRHGGHVRGIGHKVGRLAPDQPAEVRFLVAAFADQPQNRLGFGKGALPLADFQIFLAGTQGREAVRSIHDRKAGFIARRRKTAQHRIGEAVKGPALNAAGPVAQKPLGAVGHFPRSLAGEGQKQNLRRRHALFNQPRQAVNNGAGFARARPGHHQKRPVKRGRGLVLGRVKFALVINDKRHELCACPRCLILFGGKKTASRAVLF